MLKSATNRTSSSIDKYVLMYLHVKFGPGPFFDVFIFPMASLEDCSFAGNLAMLKKPSQEPVV